MFVTEFLQLWAKPPPLATAGAVLLDGFQPSDRSNQIRLLLRPAFPLGFGKGIHDHYSLWTFPPQHW